MQTLTYTNEKSERLDKYLTEQLPAISRTQWQKAIKQKDVLVNNEPAKPHDKLVDGDAITIKAEPEKETVTLPTMDIEILNQATDYLIINKPSGLPVHPDDKHSENTLIQQIIRLFPDIKDLDPDNTRPGVVHRLDKDVSGVMVIARTLEMYGHLKEQFQQRKTYKEYTALVHGSMPREKETIELNIERSKKTGKMITRPSNQEGKNSITTYEVIEAFEHFSLLKIIITTGRTHQIRTVMRSLDHPIVGDTLYSKKKTKADIKELSRPFLHSTKLGFSNLENEWQEFSSPLPTELDSILKTLT